CLVPSWCRRRARVDGATILCYPSVAFFDRLRALRAAPFVTRGRELAFELLACELQRFDGLCPAQLLGISKRRAHLRPLALEILHSFLDSRFRINQTFASITHLDSLRSRSRSTAHTPHYKMAG